MAAAKNEQFTEAYERWGDAIFRHCYYRVYRRDRAEELMQETFVKTWEYFRTNNIDNLRAFLYRVANNLIIDESRRQHPTASLEILQDEGFEPSNSVERGSLENFLFAKAVRAVLEQLEEPYREAVILRYLDELSPKEIAAVIGESENVVSVRIHRGLKKARELMEQLGDFS